jgi:hypothetical protein
MLKWSVAPSAMSAKRTQLFVVAWSSIARLWM